MYRTQVVEVSASFEYNPSPPFSCIVKFFNTNVVLGNSSIVSGTRDLSFLKESVGVSNAT